MFCRNLIKLAVFAAVVSQPLVINAQPREADETVSHADEQTARARALFSRGVQLSGQEKWAEAERAFAESARLVPAPNCLLNLAATRFRLGRPVAGLEAIAQFEALGSNVPGDQAERARAIRVHLEGQLATRILKVKPASAEVRIDGQLVASAKPIHNLRLDPGTHQLAVSAKGYVESREQLQIEAGSNGELVIELSKLPESIAGETVAQPKRPEQPVRPMTANLSPTESKPSDADRNNSKPIWMSPWLWAGVGVVAAGVSVAIIVLSSDTAEPIRGSEGISISF